MIKLTPNLWIGNSGDERADYLHTLGIDAVLNVAQDIMPTRGWDEIEYWHVGLMDGPGNTPAAYHSAVLALDDLLRRRKVLVCCHTGSRALAVAIMWMHLKKPRSFGLWLDSLKEQSDVDLPAVNEAHAAAFSRINWKALALCAMGDG